MSDRQTHIHFSTGIKDLLYRFKLSLTYRPISTSQAYMVMVEKFLWLKTLVEVTETVANCN